MPNLARDLTAGFAIGSKIIEGRRQAEEDAWLAAQTPKIEAQMAEAEKLRLTRQSRLQTISDRNRAAFGGGTDNGPISIGSVGDAGPSIAPADGSAAPDAAGGNWLSRTLDAVGLGPTKARMPDWAVKAALFPGNSNDWLSSLLGGGGVSPRRSARGTDLSLPNMADEGDPALGAGEALALRGLPRANVGSRGNPDPATIALAQRAGQQYRLDPSVLLGVMQAESNFNPNAVSSANAGGLMQLLPGTAREMNPAGDRFNPEDNVGMGAKYLAQLIAANGGSLERGLMGYHAGPGNLARGNIGPQTRAYVQKVLGLIPNYSGYDQSLRG